MLPGIILAQGSYEPQAGEVGSAAIPAESICFVDWAISCSLERGYMNIAEPDSGVATSGVSVYASGPSDLPRTVSLGDGGVATLQFSAPFYDGEGYDLAVFENGFGSGADAFLELAFVEVSSDGVNFFRFPATSEVQTINQTTAFGYTDATELDGLAGKYIGGFGTPFDLADIPDTSLLDKTAVTHVKIIDVVGSIDPTYGSEDHQGNLINDPWPTTIPSSGFDLDAVGVIHSTIPAGVKKITGSSRMIEPTFDLLGRPVGLGSNVLLVTPKGVHLSAP